MLLKISKNSTKSKAVSSYMLSGINIKRMIQDEMSENNASDISIVRVNKRPIFKVKEKEKGEKENSNAGGSLPNKSFKIRSYTRKMKEGKEGEESCEIFEKVEKVRNSRANSNRIQIFNLSKESREKEDNELRIQTKIREILQRQATIKCKATNQVFVKQPAPKLTANPTMHYQRLATQKYREMAHKVTAHFNPQFQNSKDKTTLLIVSMEALSINSRRITKNNNAAHEEGKNVSPPSQQQIELLKMLSCKHYQDEIWSDAKLAFKVNNASEMQQLRSTLELNHITDYYCIFYPIKKYVQCWNLYQIDGMLQDTAAVVLLQAKYKLKDEFPILSSQKKTIFVVTSNDNFVMLSRTLSAIKSFLNQQKPQSLPVVDVEDSIGEIEAEKENTKEVQANVPQFGLREEQIEINWSQLDARLDFTINSKEMKNSHARHQNKSSCSKEPRGKRRVLCERDNNCPLTYSKNNRNINFTSASVEDNKWEFESVKQESLESMKQNLLFCLRTERMKEAMSQNNRRAQWPQKGEKDDELDDITSYVRGSCCRSKTNHQLISELVKKNATIHRQIEQYLASIAHLAHLANPNSISISIFNDRQEEDEPVHENKPIKMPIHAYKIL